MGSRSTETPGGWRWEQIHRDTRRMEVGGRSTETPGGWRWEQIQRHQEDGGGEQIQRHQEDGGGGEPGVVSFQGDRVSVWEGETVLETDGGDGNTTV